MLFVARRRRRGRVDAGDRATTRGGCESASLLTIDGARHEILQEADIYREQLLAAFDAFVPGSDAGVDALTVAS